MSICKARAKLEVLGAVIDPEQIPDGALGKPRLEIARRLIREAAAELDKVIAIRERGAGIVQGLGLALYTDSAWREEDERFARHVVDILQEKIATRVVTPEVVARLAELDAAKPAPEAATPPALPKPASVRVGQRWRCVGVEGEIVVEYDEVNGKAWPDGSRVQLRAQSGIMWARAADMLGLREWSYMGGAS